MALILGFLLIGLFLAAVVLGAIAFAKRNDD